MSSNLNDIAILNICSVDYCCAINGIDKREAMNLLQNADLTEKREVLQKNYHIYKMGKEIITFGNTEVEKHKFHQCKNPILIGDASIRKIIVSNKVL